MSVATSDARRLRRRRRVRAKISGTATRPRVSVFRSNRGLCAQLVDDTSGHTLAAVAWFEPELRSLLARFESPGAAEAAAGRQRALTAAVSAIVRAARPIGPMAVVSTPSGDPEIWGGFLSRSSRSALAARGLGVVVGDEPTGALAPRARDRRRRAAQVRDHLAGAATGGARERLGGLLVGGHGAARVAHPSIVHSSIPNYGDAQTRR